MDSQKPLEQVLKEIYSHYPEAIETWVKVKKSRLFETPLLKDTMDETFLTVAKVEGYKECLYDLLNDFRV